MGSNFFFKFSLSNILFSEILACQATLKFELNKVYVKIIKTLIFALTKNSTITVIFTPVSLQHETDLDRNK